MGTLLFSRDHATVGLRVPLGRDSDLLDCGKTILIHHGLRRPCQRYKLAVTFP